MSTAGAIPIENPAAEKPWVLPNRGVVGMYCLILAESAIFIIFVVAYIFYIGKSLTGPTPAQVLEIPIFATVCLLSSSITIHFAVGTLRKDNRRAFTLWLAATVIFGLVHEEHAERLEVLSLYWHFVDAVWIVVFLVVYVLGR